MDVSRQSGQVPRKELSNGNRLRAGKTFLGARDSFFGGGKAFFAETAKRFPAAGQFMSSDFFMGQIQTEGGENNGAKYQSQNNNGGRKDSPKDLDQSSGVQEEVSTRKTSM